MTGAQEVATVLAEFAQLIADEHDAQDVLWAAGDFCTKLLPVHGIGVLLLEDRGLAVGTANSPEGETVEQLEVQLREGPCTDAVRSGIQVLVPDLEAARQRYPRFAPAAMGAGIHSIHALPMSSRGRQVGALDIVCREPLALSAEDVATAQLLADVTMAYLTNVRIREASDELANQLQHALDSRVVIEQAKGRLAERHGESPGEAFERLRRYARTKRRTVRSVAEDVLGDELDL